MQVLTAIMIYFERKRGVRSSGLVIMLWISLVIYGSFKLRTYILIDEDAVSCPLENLT